MTITSLLIFIFTFIFFTLGAYWRRVKGSGHSPLYWHLRPLIFIIPAIAYDWHQIGLALTIAWISLLDGFKGWEDFGYMSMRYTGYAALACTLASLSPFYLVCGFISGICYPAGDYLKKHYFQDFYYTKYCELLSGGLMFGGAVYFAKGI